MISFISSLSVDGAEYYVSSAGSDAGSGTSAAPWETIAKVNSATLLVGDTIYFRCGDTWRETLVPQKSGSSSAKVTYTSYGTGAKPVISGAEIITTAWTPYPGGPANTYTTPLAIETMMVTANGAYVKGVNTPASLVADRYCWDGGLLYLNIGSDPNSAAIEVGQRNNGVAPANGRNHVTLRGLRIEKTNISNIRVEQGSFWIVEDCELYYGNSNSIAAGGGVNGDQMHDAIIRRNHINFSLGDGVLAWRSARVEVSDNLIENVLDDGGSGGADGIQIGAKATTPNACDGFKILNNVVSRPSTEVQKGCIIQEMGDNGIIAGNTCTKGRFGLACSGNNNIVEHNYVTGFGSAGGIRVSQDQDMAGMKIRYNIVSQSSGFAGITLLNDADGAPARKRSNFEIYNNVVYNTATGITNGSAINNGVSQPFSGVIRNNIVWNPGSDPGVRIAVGSLIPGETLTVSHNILRDAATQPLVSIAGSSYYDLSSLQAAGWGAGTSVADPMFENSATNDFHLAAGSPAIDAGTDVGLSVDFEGTAVPQGVQPDVGALEYYGTGVVFDPVTWDSGATPDKNWSNNTNWNPDASPASTAVTFGVTGVTANATTAGNIVDINYTGANSLSSLTYNGNSASWQVTQIASGKTLTADGTFLVGGLSGANQVTKAAFTGTGSLVINDSGAITTIANAGATTARSTLDMSALSIFTATTNSFRVGTGSTGYGTVYLADTSTITVTSINSGGDGASYGSAVSNLLYLGTTNTFNTATAALAGGRTYGTVKFRTVGAGAANNTTVFGATLGIRATDGTSRVTSVNVGGWTGTPGGSGTSTVDLTGGSVDALVTTLKVGATTSGFNTLTQNAVLSQGAGTIDATSVIAGETGAGTGSGIVTGTINVSGGMFTAGTMKLANNIGGSMAAKGTLNVSGTGAVSVTGNLVMGNRITATVTPKVNVSGGTLTVDGTLAEGTGGANNTSTVNLTGTGTLVLGGTMTVDTFSFTGGTLQLGKGGTTGALATGLVIDSSVNAANLTINRSNAVVQGTDFSGDPITGALSLTQSGAGTTTLNAANTYTGDTIVTAGTLAVNGSSILNANKLVISGGTVDLTGAETVSTLFFGAVQQAAGTYSATGANGTIPSANFSGTGTLIVLAGQGGLVDPVDPYAAWIDSPAYNTPPLTAAQKLPGADPDGDGNPNILEFATSGDPVSSSDHGKVASMIQDSGTPAGNELTLVAAVRDGAPFAGGATATVSGITYTVEGALDLVFPASAVSSTGPSDTAPAATGLPSLAGTDWEYQTFKLNASEGLGGKGFLRLKVTQP